MLRTLDDIATDPAPSFDRRTRESFLPYQDSGLRHISGFARYLFLIARVALLAVVSPPILHFSTGFNRALSNARNQRAVEHVARNRPLKL